MPINKDIKISALPLALGVVLSTTIALQPAALPGLAQSEEADSAVVVPVPVHEGGIVSFGGVEMGVPAEFAGVVTPAMADMPMAEAFAFGHEEHHHHGMFSEANKMTDDQFEKMYAIRTEAHDQMAMKGVQLRILHRKLHECLTASTIDTKQAQDLAGKIASLKNEITQTHLDTMIKMAQVLTPEQRHELHLKMIKGHHHHHHGMWMHHHHGGPGGPEGHEMHHHEGPSHEHHEEMGK